MLNSLIILSLLQIPDPKLDPQEILRTFEGLHAPIQDFEFVCEGSLDWTEAARDRRPKGRDGQSGKFQGTYAYRTDGAAYFDLYLKPFDKGALFRHNTYAQLRDKRTRISRTPDLPGTFEPQIDKGYPGSFVFPGSPERFIYLGYWRGLNYSTRDIEIESMEWDDIEGNRTLRLTINEFPKSRLPEKKWSKYWVDLNRGGHVLKHEFYAGSRMRHRTQNVVLKAVQSRGGDRLWFPIHGEYDVFRLRSGYSTVPLYHETYDVVGSSLVLNAKLTDERFSVQWTARKAESSQLKQARQEFSSTPPKPERPRMRSDTAGVQEYQQQRLAEAERQAKQLDASPPSRRSWGSDVLAQSVLAALGVGVLIMAFVLRRRTS